MKEQTMKFYCATVETTSRDKLTGDRIDQLMDALAAYHPAVGAVRGWVTASITFPAESLAQAATTAAAVVAAAVGAEALTLEVMPESERDLREGWRPAPADLVDVAESATMLGVSPQRVRQMIEEGKLGAHRVGERTLVLDRAEVAARAAAR